MLNAGLSELGAFMQYRIEFLDHANVVVGVVHVGAGSGANAFLFVTAKDWPPNAVTARAIYRNGRRGPSVFRPPMTEDEFVAQWRERLASNPRFTEDRGTGGGTTLHGDPATTPPRDPEALPSLKPEEAKPGSTRAR